MANLRKMCSTYGYRQASQILLAKKYDEDDISIIIFCLVRAR